MRRKAQKKIEQFVDTLIKNSSEEERGSKTRDQLITNVKQLWVSQGKNAQKFINAVNSGAYGN